MAKKDNFPDRNPPPAPRGPEPPGPPARYTYTEASALTYSSPIPPPEILIGYNHAIPNGAERLLVMAEKQSEHRIDIEKKAVAGENFRAALGIFCGLAIALGGLVVAYLLAMAGKEATAIAVVGIDLGAIAGVFVFGTVHRGQERKEKAQLMAGAPPNPGGTPP